MSRDRSKDIDAVVGSVGKIAGGQVDGTARPGVPSRWDEIVDLLWRVVESTPLTQTQIATFCNMSQPSVSRLFSRRPERATVEMARDFVRFMYFNRKLIVDKRDHDLVLELAALYLPSSGPSFEDVGGWPAVPAGDSGPCGDDDLVMPDAHAMACLVGFGYIHFLNNNLTLRLYTSDEPLRHTEVYRAFRWFVARPEIHIETFTSLQARRLELDRSTIRDVARKITNLIIEPAVIDDDGALSGKNAISRAALPGEPRYVKMWAHGDHGLLSTKRIPECAPRSRRQHRILSVDPIFDVSALIRTFLKREFGLSDNSARNTVQRWVRSRYGIRYDEGSRELVGSVVRRLNEYFFDIPRPRRRDFHIGAKNAIDVRLLEKMLTTSIGGQTPGVATRSDHAAEIAVGFSLYLRFLGVLRERVRILESDEGVRAVPYVLANYVLEQSYLVTSIFGESSSISGMNFLFRGGFMPCVDEGRALAIVGAPGTGKTGFGLHVSCDFAGRGGLSIYLAIEESVSTVLNRITMFDLVNDEFIVYRGHEDFMSRRDDGDNRQVKRGALVIYGIDDLRGLTLGTVLDRYESEGDDFDGRAITIDSVDAMYAADATTRSSRNVKSPQSCRDQMHEFLSMVVRRRYLGIMLFEDRPDALSNIGHLVDTYFQLGVDDQDVTRTLQIRKCRIQDFHPGVHTFSMNDGVGIKIHPNRSAVISAVRSRARTMPSAERAIEVSLPWLKCLPAIQLREKATCYLDGEGRRGTELFAAGWLISRVVSIGMGDQLRPHPKAVLVVTFQDSAAITKRRLGEIYRNAGAEFQTAFEKDMVVHYRYFHPGETMTAGQLLREIWETLTISRNQGRPIERILVKNAGMLARDLPLVAADKLFWSSFLELVTTEPVSTLIVGRDSGEIDPRDQFQALQDSVDYVIRSEPDVSADPLDASADPDDAQTLVVERTPMGPF